MFKYFYTLTFSVTLAIFGCIYMYSPTDAFAAASVNKHNLTAPQNNLNAPNWNRRTTINHNRTNRRNDRIANEQLQRTRELQNKQDRQRNDIGK